MNGVNSVSTGSFSHAHFDDLDLSDPADFEAWQARIEEVARVRLDLHRERLIAAQVISAQGEACSDLLPLDMRAGSQVSLGC